MENKHYTLITAEHKFLDLKLKEVWKYRDLIVLFTKRYFTVQYKQTVLGPAWLFLNPIISSLIYCFIFGGIAGMGTDGIPQILFYMSGNAIWGYFSSCLNNNANTFKSNAHVFGKVYFPRLTVPISNVFASVIKFGIQMILTVAFLVFYCIKGDVHPNWWALCFLPVILIELGLMGMGLGIIISSLTTKYRDLSVLVGFGVQLWMYITPIVYPLSQSGDSWYKYILLINPVTAPVELFRYALLGQGTVQLPYIIFSVVFTMVVTILGIMIFNKVEKTFMDTV
ncbi:MAG: ABC transporter permease [Clostridia bacterium]|nr:ABC transporter permease [Clostridia bacterium]